jgi:hypothetical protein
MEHKLWVRAWERRRTRTTGPRHRRRKARHPGRRHQAQRQGVLEPRLLRHGLPDQRQAVDAGDDDSGRARTAARRSTPGCAPTACASPATASAPSTAGAAARRHPSGSGKRVQLRARHFVIAGGAIGSPALLLRSGVPDPYRLLGKRTFLHPVVISSALMPERVDAYAGAPQSIYSDHFLQQAPIDGPLGFKLEVPPLHPVLFSTTLQGFGEAHARADARIHPRQRRCWRCCAMVFIPRAAAARCGSAVDGLPVLDYPLGDVIWEAARRALLAMAEIQFAAGARWVTPVHETHSRLYELGRSRAGDRRTAAQAAALPRGQRARDGRLRDGRRPRRVASSTTAAGTSGSPTCRCTTDRSFRPASAPIRSSRSTAWSPATPACWPPNCPAGRCRSFPDQDVHAGPRPAFPCSLEVALYVALAIYGFDASPAWPPWRRSLRPPSLRAVVARPGATPGLGMAISPAPRLSLWQRCCMVLGEYAAFVLSFVVISSLRALVDGRGSSLARLPRTSLQRTARRPAGAAGARLRLLARRLVVAAPPLAGGRLDGGDDQPRTGLRAASTTTPIRSRGASTPFSPRPVPNG